MAKKRVKRPKPQKRKPAYWEVRELRERQRRFIREYCLCGNASEAYRKAYQTTNVKVSNVESTRLMKDPRILSEIEEWRRQQAFKFEITSESLLQELASIAYFDMRNVIEEGSRCNPKPIDEMPPYVSRAIQQISPGEHGIGIKGYDKVRAIEMLRKILKENAGTGQQSRDDARKALFERISGVISKRKE